MARIEWWSVRVELLGGGAAGELWPRPGRVFAVSTGHTLHDLAEAIDDAFVRFGRGHLRRFEFPAIGKRAVERCYGDAGDHGAGLDADLDADRVRIGDVLEPDAGFAYAFGQEDTWRHHCRVAAQPIVPATVLGMVPDHPVPYWGWGTVPHADGGTLDEGAEPPRAGASRNTWTTLHCPDQYTGLTPAPPRLH